MTDSPHAAAPSPFVVPPPAQAREPGEVRILDTHDWETLRHGYNFPSPRNRRPVFVDLLRAEARRLRARGEVVRALDIGCGHGISEDVRVNAAYLRGVRDVVDALWGIEPDETVMPAHGMLDRLYRGTLETVELGEERVNLAYSYMVQEHVAGPEAFFRAVYRALAPGGVYLGMTVNGRHGFALITRTLRALRLDEIVLRVIFRRAELGYHYPVRYRANTEAQVTAAARAAGFPAPTFATLENAETRGYFKGPLRPLYWLMRLKRRVLRRPGSLVTLIVRLEKPAG